MPSRARIDAVRPSSGTTLRQAGFSPRSAAWAIVLLVAILPAGCRDRSDDAEAYCSRGFAHAEKGEYDLAIKDYGKAIDLNPDYALAYYNRGFAYQGKGQ